jgi:hypothetical protein
LHDFEIRLLASVVGVTDYKKYVMLSLWIVRYSRF